MNPRTLAYFTLCLFVASIKSYADGFSPEESRARMVLPDGFKAEVFASEPMIRQPVTASFDERGRMWVIEYLQYPVPAGLKPVKVDQYLRTVYDKIPQPPPRGVKGADRIKILEDTDGDGKADKATIFVEGLNLASGLAVGHGGVWVGQAPYLLFYADKDKNDVPDGDPEVCLTGFGLEDAHATVNSMAFGPDGWLYGAQGSTVTANIRGIGFQQGIWRYHPKTKEFELFAEGGGNTWGLDWDATGNAFGSSNGTFITFHMVQGGYFWKGFAKHGPLHNPHTYGYFDAIAYDGPKKGGHVTPGGIIYKGDAYPEAFRNKFIGGNLLSNAVYWHDLTPEGSTFRGKHGGTLIEANDKWFRPIDLTVGPDGCVYVVDWYDRRASHLDPRDTWDKTNGRIYRVAYGEPKHGSKIDLSKRTTADLIATRTAKNDWEASEARKILYDRKDPTGIAPLRSFLKSDREPAIAARDLWNLNACGGLTDEAALELLEHPVPAVRMWTIRLLGDEHRMNPSLRASLVNLAETETNPLVRSQLASSTQRWKTADAFPIIDVMLGHAADNNDSYIPLLLWWACERHLSISHEQSLTHMLTSHFIKRPVVRSTVLERLARLLISSGSAGDDASAAKLVGLLGTEAEADKVVSGLLKGLEGRRLDHVPASLTQALAGLKQGETPKLDRKLLAIRLGDADAYRRGAAATLNPKEDDATRLALVELLGQTPRAEGLAALLTLVKTEKKANILNAALAALGGYDSPNIAMILLDTYKTLNSSARSRVIDLFIARKESAAKLVDALANSVISPKDVTIAQVLKLHAYGDSHLSERLTAAWGRLPGPGSPEKIRRIAEVRGLLPEGDKGDPKRGALVFKEQCAVCHRLFNDGEKIGPELTQAERGNLDFLLTSLVDPSALIRKEYQSRTVVTTDGRTLNGLVIDENDKTITLVDSKRVKTLIMMKEIEQSKSSDISLMPEGLLDTLKEAQIRDLFRYLQSSGPATR